MHLAQKLVTQIAQGESPDVIAALFSDDVRFEIAGDVGALPWIGQKTGRSAASDFFRDVRALVEPLRFDVESILADETHAVIVGDLASKSRATGKVVETAFALVLTITGPEITRFQMLEDSFAVSRAARPDDPARIRLESAYSFSVTLDRLRSALESSGSAGLDLPPTTVIVYGNPRAGTPLMQAAPDFALDLPLRVLVRADAAGKIFVTFHPASRFRGEPGLPSELTDKLGAAERIIAAAIGHSPAS
jgi:uncharacterized protein (DUF302 family)/ketosteroid isomerase-like protein